MASTSLKTYQNQFRPGFHWGAYSAPQTSAHTKETHPKPLDGFGLYGRRCFNPEKTTAPPPRKQTLVTALKGGTSLESLEQTPVTFSHTSLCIVLLYYNTV